MNELIELGYLSKLHSFFLLLIRIHIFFTYFFFGFSQRHHHSPSVDELHHVQFRFIYVLELVSEIEILKFFTRTWLKSRHQKFNQIWCFPLKINFQEVCHEEIKKHYFSDELIFAICMIITNRKKFVWHELINKIEEKFLTLFSQFSSIGTWEKPHECKLPDAMISMMNEIQNANGMTHST